MMRYLVPFLLWLPIAMADDAPVFSGSGCPAGSVSVAFAPDHSAVSVLFDRFTVEAGGASLPKKASKDCRITIPVEVPKGMQVAVGRIDYRGFFDLPAHARARLVVKNAFRGNGGPEVKRDFGGPATSDFFETNQVNDAEIRWSPCGGLDSVTVITSLELHSPKERALLTLDSEDASGSRGFVYRLQWRECRERR
ncbi:MAG TPA: DUF4360 domain-containing protein [Bdellovibrionota bacterium]|nr:DUF4360 domain-containing protein [Bdellovibrionota bacterium]